MTLLEEARGLIKAYLTSKPHISVAALARSAGMPASTARSIIQGEVQKTSLVNLVNLLQVFMGYEEINALVSKYDPNSAEAAHISFLTKKKAKFVESQSFEYETPDQNILALASSLHGVSRDKIRKEYGEHGLRRLDRLLNSGMLREINNRIKQQAEHVEYPITDTQKKVGLQANNWKPEDMDLGGFIFHLTQNYTPEAHDQAISIIKEAILKLTDLETTNEHGDKVVLISFICNLLDGEKQ